MVGSCGQAVLLDTMKCLSAHAAACPASLPACLPAQNPSQQTKSPTLTERREQILWMELSSTCVSMALSPAFMSPAAAALRC